MGLLKRLEGKTELELIVMEIGDIIHTLRKNGVGDKNTQDEYALECLDNCKNRLRRLPVKE
jgi:hypothetical protein